MSARRALGVPEPRFVRDVAVQRMGSGPPIVCLHAIGHGGADFLPLASRVCDRHELVIVDWPGHGASAGDGLPVRARRYAELASSILDALGIARPIVLGCSIGGAAAIELAARRDVAALVLCNAGGLAPIDRSARLAIRWMQRFFAAGDASWFPLAYALYYRMVLPEAPAHRARIVAAGRELAPLLRSAWQGFGEEDADVRALAATLRVPVLAAWAARDRVVPLSRSRAALEAIPDVRIETFDAGHAAFLEAPEAFAASHASDRRRSLLKCTGVMPR
jgi:4,5:9,10-diseco-3-hydroxy-5,9,17-trioxoandrosta-1(10),2-diene-4-oate hydrolase